MNTIYRLIAAAVLLVLIVIGTMHYENYRTEQQAFEAMGEAQMLREQLRQEQGK